jgi:hypothetical protein
VYTAIVRQAALHGQVKRVYYLLNYAAIYGVILPYTPQGRRPLGVL